MPKPERLEPEAELVVTETETGLESCRKAPLNFGEDKSLAQRLGYKLVSDIPKEKIPGGKGVKKGGEKAARVIVIGDVHGMFHECRISLLLISLGAELDSRRMLT